MGILISRQLVDSCHQQSVMFKQPQRLIMSVSLLGFGSLEVCQYCNDV